MPYLYMWTLRSISNVKLLPSVYLFNIFINVFFSPSLFKILALPFCCVYVSNRFFFFPYSFFFFCLIFFLHHLFSFLFFRVWKFARYFAAVNRRRTRRAQKKKKKGRKKNFVSENAMPNRQIHINIAQCQLESNTRAKQSKASEKWICEVYAKDPESRCHLYLYVYNNC